MNRAFERLFVQRFLAPYLDQLPAFPVQPKPFLKLSCIEQRGISEWSLVAVRYGDKIPNWDLVAVHYGEMPS